MNNFNYDIHIAQLQRKKSKRTTFVWHQHVDSCVLHHYEPIVGQTIRLDVRAGSRNKKKHKVNLSNY